MHLTTQRLTSFLFLSTFAHVLLFWFFSPFNDLNYLLILFLIEVILLTGLYFFLSKPLKGYLIPAIIISIIQLTTNFGLNAANFEYGFFTKYNAFSASTDIANNDIKIICPGDPNAPHILNQVAKKYGFRYIFGYPLGEGNGFIHYNHVVIDYLNIKHGPNWQNELENEFRMRLKQTQSKRRF